MGAVCAAAESGKLLCRTHRYAEVTINPIGNCVYPTVYEKIFTSIPGIADNGCFAGAYHLFHYIDFAKSVQLTFIVHDAFQFAGVEMNYVLNVAQPIVDKAVSGVFKCSRYAPASVMAANDYMPYFQNLDGKLHNRKAVHIAVDYQICHISMNEHLARKQPDA